MRNAKVLTKLLAAGLAFSGPLVAHAKGKGGGGGESQKGGLPALEDRVDAADALITTLQGQVLDLQGQNNWAVIDGTTMPGTPTVVRSNPAGVTVSLVSTGVYEVTFTKDALCPAGRCHRSAATRYRFRPNQRFGGERGCGQRR
jgi:hypothetical protein